MITEAQKESLIQTILENLNANEDCIGNENNNNDAAIGIVDQWITKNSIIVNE